MAVLSTLTLGGSSIVLRRAWVQDLPMEHDRRSFGGHAPSERGADPTALAGAGHDHDPTSQGPPTTRLIMA